MKLLTKTLLAFTFVCFFVGSYAQSPAYTNKLKETEKRMEWHKDARFGMFIHWGPYSIPSRGEWVKTNEKITTEQYQKYVDAFYPTKYDANEWANIAKQAGMKYAVMTAKHHDGFCMYDSKLTDYKITKNMPNRDFIREYVDAFKKAGLKVGFYYSLIDWYHKDYPNVGNHPMRENKQYAIDYAARKGDWSRYIKYMHGQIEELMTNYGQIDVLWLDYSFPGFESEKWKAKELIEMIKKHQPNIIINNRLVAAHWTGSENFEMVGYGDFMTPEQGVPDETMYDKFGNEVPWETCLTLNNSWGYNSGDEAWKSPELVINTLVNCVSKNGNLLLNVGPDSQGVIPEGSKKTLKKVGEWMKINGESIYGCKDLKTKKPEWGYYTQKGDVVYAHVNTPVLNHINIGELGKNVKDVFVLQTKEKAATSPNWWGGNGKKDNFFINIKNPTYLSHEFPDRNDTVFKIVSNKN